MGNRFRRCACGDKVDDLEIRGLSFSGSMLKPQSSNSGPHHTPSNNPNSFRKHKLNRFRVDPVLFLQNPRR